MNLFPISGNDQKGEDAFWVGFSRFQVPRIIERYKGTAPSQVYMVLFRLACSISYRSRRVSSLTVAKPNTFFCKQTKLSLRAVERAFTTLERDGLLAFIPREDRVVKRRAEGTFLSDIVVLLHPVTREPLYTVPGSFSVCYRNGVRP